MKSRGDTCRGGVLLMFERCSMTTSLLCLEAAGPVSGGDPGGLYGYTGPPKWTPCRQNSIQSNGEVDSP